MNEIVSLTTADVSRAIPVTNSKIVAEKYEVQHATVSRLINKYEDDFKELGKVDRKSVV